jgi:hypothetical protein
MIIEQLKLFPGKRVHVSIDDLDEHDPAASFIENMRTYEAMSHDEIRGAIGSWPVRARIQGDDVFLEELHEDEKCFCSGLTRAYQIWSDQQQLCAELGLPFLPPDPLQLAAVSPDFWSCAGVQGFRLEAPPHMSGWWLYPDDQPDVDFSIFKTTHIYHCIVRHKNIARFLALPTDYRFLAVPGMVIAEATQH